MKAFKQELLSRLSLPPRLAELLPAGYQRIGDIVLLRLRPKLKKFQKEIGLAVKEILSASSVCSIEGFYGATRRPKVKLIAGSSTKTVHTEYGCKFCIDVSKVMWAKGNHTERARLAKLVRPGETVIDMFAGLGYWSIFIAKVQPECKIYAIDINPVAIGYLKENIRLNKVSNIIPILGDCRNVKIPQKADRVIMGWLFGTENFLPKVIGLLKDCGIVHYHFLTKNKDFETEIEKIKNVIKKCKIKILHKGIVKSWGPRVWHGVADLEFKKI